MKAAAGFEIFPEQAFPDGIEFELDQQLFEGFFVWGPELERLQVVGAGGVANNGGEALGEQSLLAMDGEVFLEFAEPNWPINLMAVFSPMPGTPGMLSEESPIRARMSTTCSGRWMPQRCRISGGPRISMPLPMRDGLYRKIWSVINWPKSLSGVTM